MFQGYLFTVLDRRCPFVRLILCDTKLRHEWPCRLTLSSFVSNDADQPGFTVHGTA